MSLCVGEVEATAEGVAQLVVDGHAHAAQADPAQPGSVQSTGPGRLKRWVLDNLGESGCKGPRTFDGHHVDDGVGVAGVEGFDCGSCGVSARLLDGMFLMTYQHVR